MWAQRLGRRGRQPPPRAGRSFPPARRPSRPSISRCSTRPSRLGCGSMGKLALRLDHDRVAGDGVEAADLVARTALDALVRIEIVGLDRGPVMASVGHTCTQRWQPVHLPGMTRYTTRSRHTTARQRFCTMCSTNSSRKYLNEESTGLGAVWPSPHSEALLTTRARRSRRSRSASSPLPAQIRIQDAHQVPGAHAAGHALAAALLGGEVEEEAGEVDHAGGVVDDHHAAGAHHRPGRDEALEVDRLVEQALRQAAARRPAELHRLEACRPGSMPPPMSKMTWRSVAPIGTSTSRRWPTLPVSEKILVPLRARGADGGESRRRRC